MIDSLNTFISNAEMNKSSIYNDGSAQKIHKTQCGTNYFRNPSS